MGVRRFVGYSFWLTRALRSEEWFGKNAAVRSYVEQTMLDVSTEEYLKIYDALYDFKLLELSKIKVPTLILNGEHESKSVFRHAEEMHRRIPDTESHVIPGAGHTSNMENPVAFDAALKEFLKRNG